DKGVWFKMVSGGGGGYGSALDRPPEVVVDDVAFGLVSREAAEREYRVVVIEQADGSLGFDAAATDALRRQMRSAPRPRQQEREQILARVRQRVASGAPDAQTESVAAEAERRIAHMRKALAAAGRTDPGARPGRSLRIPYLNDRAMEYWDVD